jgi:hypothetical protein
MKNPTFTTISLAVSMSIGFSASALVTGAAQRDRNDGRATQYAGSLDARQHGYEHAYRDGADRGRQDREGKHGYTLRDNDYVIGARSYEPAFGDRTQYMQGYHEGYTAGYDDGYNGRDGQYGSLYARPQGGGRASTRDPYADRPYSSTDMAFDAGYREGVTLGQQDRARNARSDFQDSASYRNGDLGYRSSYGDRQEYQRQFRDGIERGYEDGLGRSRSGTGAANAYRNGSSRPSNGDRSDLGTRNAQGSQGTLGGTFTVPANRQWTPTGIRVNQGDLLRFTSTGEVHFTGNPNDRAGVAGSPDHKFVATAPLPHALAGALIGRIDNGLPFGIGDSTTITAPASGLLYLGTNDDNVNDNSGQFQVVISFGR